MDHSKIFIVFIPLGGVLWMSSSLLISEVVGKPNPAESHRSFCAEVEGNRPGRAKKMLICIRMLYIQYGPLAKSIYTFCIEVFDIHQDGSVGTQQLHQANVLGGKWNSVGGRGIRSCHNLVKARVGSLSS